MMDLNLITYILISLSALILRTKASFPFETGPIIFNPYGSFFASSELDPFDVNKYANEISKHKRDYYKKMHPNYYRNRMHDKSMKSSYRTSKSELSSERFPIDAIKSESSIPIKVQPKRKYQKMRIPSLKYNYNHKVPIVPIRPKHNEDLQFKKQFLSNLDNQKVSLNYKNSNNEQQFPRKPVFNEHLINTGRAPNFDEKPSNYDIDLSGEMSISSDDESKQNIRQNKNKVQYLSPPLKYEPNFQKNYFPKEREISLRPQRPALYQMDPPKNLNMRRPGLVFQKVEVPHQTLLDIAGTSGPKYDVNRFYPSSRPKLEVILKDSNSRGSNSRQVGASMSVKPNSHRTEVKGKVFDEPLSSAIKQREIKPDNYKKYTDSKAFDSDVFSFSNKPIKFDAMNAFNYKPFQPFPGNKQTITYQNSEDFRKKNSKPSHQQSISNNNENNNKIIESKTNTEPNNDKYETDYEEEEEEYGQENSENQYPNHSPQTHSNVNSNNRKQHSFKSEPQKPFVLNDNEENKSDQEEETEEWTSSGIPGEPGKDYPMLSAVPLKSEFSCSGKPHGFYADISQKCQVYHQCSSQGQQKFLCPNGTLFNQESLVCEWWYNVYCENSDKLYHKNAQLYQTNSGDQNNDFNKNNVEPNWNHNRDNNNNNNNNNNYKEFRNRNYYNDDDGKNANNFKISSNVRERHSLPNNDQNDDEINVDFSNEEMSESRDKLFKTKLTDKLVPNINLINKTKLKI